MEYLVTGAEMKAFDQNTSEHFGVPPAVLMEQAAQAFVEKMLAIHPAPGRVLVVCGCGNNGGDGVAIARLLNQRGIEAYVLAPKREHASELFALQWGIYRSYGYPLARSPRDGTWEVVVDAIFGTGLSRPIGEPYASLIDELNGLPAHRIAVDIASGISSDDGSLPGCAFCARDTITFSFAKLSSCLWPGASYSGTVHVVPIGITEESFRGKIPQAMALGREDLSLLPRRIPNSNKGTYGRLLVIAGSRSMAGAAILSTSAAYRTGCGLVKLVTVEENRAVALSAVPEAILSLYGDRIDSGRVLEDLAWADAIVMGPGIGTDGTAAELLKLVLIHRKVPIVLDADALNLLAGEAGLLEQALTEGMIVTPHPGEMCRLTGRPVSELKLQLLEEARSFARARGCITVLKDSRTVTALPDGRAYLNLSGNNGMATAGSGDVLAGIIGGLLAQGLSPETAAPLGVYLHGLAGDAARDGMGAAGMLAHDIVDRIAQVEMGS